MRRAQAASVQVYADDQLQEGSHPALRPQGMRSPAGTGCTIFSALLQHTYQNELSAFDIVFLCYFV